MLEVPVARCGHFACVARQRPLDDDRRRDVLDVGDGLRAVDGHALAAEGGDGLAVELQHDGHRGAELVDDGVHELRHARAACD